MPPWMLNGLLGVHALATLMMTGLIWMVQVVHYPLFARVGEAAFVDYEARHTRRISWLVIPLMVAEAGTAFALLFLLATRMARGLAATGFVLLLVVWTSTALLQVPCHVRLQRGYDADTIRRLVATNWIRTIAWSVRGVLAIGLLKWPS